MKGMQPVPAKGHLSAEAEALREDLAGRIAAHHQIEGEMVTPIPGLTLYRRTERTNCTSSVLEPCIILYAQGEKRVLIGETSYECDGGHFRLTSVDLPAISEVTRASKEEPLLGLILKVDMPAVREILSQEDFMTPEPAFEARGMVMGETPADLLSACCRLLDLLDTPRDIPFLSGLMQREILYRVLRGPLGGNLRAIATHGEQGNRTAKAVAWLKANYSRPLRVEELARVAQMGVSTFHHHFRSLTQMSPLQYQKRMRLHAARVRMMTEGLDAASAAFEVGYESASQFSREYRRFFGQPPMRDVTALRLAGAVAEE